MIIVVTSDIVNGALIGALLLNAYVVGKTKRPAKEPELEPLPLATYTVHRRGGYEDIDHRAANAIFEDGFLFILDENGNDLAIYPAAQVEKVVVTNRE